MYTVGQQLLNGQVVIVSISPTGVIVVKFIFINDGIGNPLTLTYDPAGTTMPLEAWLQAIIDLLT